MFAFEPYKCYEISFATIAAIAPFLTCDEDKGVAVLKWSWDWQISKSKLGTSSN